MLVNSILAILGAFTGLGALANSILARRGDRANSKTIAALDSSKLDVDVAQLGHNILVASMQELRTQVAECHEERDEFRTLLEDHGLIPR